jgi:hypothetical protein
LGRSLEGNPALKVHEHQQQPQDQQQQGFPALKVHQNQQQQKPKRTITLTATVIVMASEPPSPPLRLKFEVLLMRETSGTCQDKLLQARIGLLGSKSGSASTTSSM